MSTTAQVFICYAHKDKLELERLQMHLAFLEGSLIVWSDQRLEIGDQWNEEIERTLQEVKAAILLISPAFLASKYIRNNELPVLLHRAQEQGIIILPIILSPCAFEEAKFRFPDPQIGPLSISLSIFQAVNSIDNTIRDLTEAQQDALYLKVARRVMKICAEEAAKKPASGEPDNEISQRSIYKQPSDFSGESHVRAQNIINNSGVLNIFSAEPKLKDLDRNLPDELARRNFINLLSWIDLQSKTLGLQDLTIAQQNILLNIIDQARKKELNFRPIEVDALELVTHFTFYYLEKRASPKFNRMPKKEYLERLKELIKSNQKIRKGDVALSNFIEDLEISKLIKKLEQ